ncbi:DNA damage-regulated autophagy modulator protein 1 [Caerostris darwini]|uniref:DNA damage-regulated autophagy modulator protein 1 n=1 Tax=Caerostris darwini TaxID=1538125 RepID=A0AAV4Q155_9ARAC|nr:DNA damage-regulated autophagy modulator protein 1 [Caerostris darwini]
MEPALTTTFKNIQFIPICQVIVLTGTALISFIVAYGYGDVSIYLPFISETGAKVPAMCLFTYGLFFGAVAGSITVCYRFLILNHMLANAVQWLKTINTIAVFIGLLSMAGLAGVAAFPVSSVIWAHLVAAGVHFVGGLSYIILQTVIDYWKPATNKLLIKNKNSSLFTTSTLLISLGNLFPSFFLQVASSQRKSASG